MSGVNDLTVGRRRRIRALRGVALAAALAFSTPAWTQSIADYAAYPANIDCDNPYYLSYCLAYAAWLDQYYAAYGYPYNYWFGYPFVAVGIGFFHGHHFHNFHHFVFAHGIGFHRGFHGGGFHGGGFHGGGHR